MSWLWAETIIQIVGELFLAPLVFGITNRLKAIVESRHGPGIFQPYYDLAKYLRKEILIPENSTALFYVAPFFVFGTYLLISFVIPVILPFPVYFTPTVDFLGGGLLFTLTSFLLILGALNSENNISAMGASRSATFSAFAEPTLIMVFFAVALISGTNNPYTTSSLLSVSVVSYLGLYHLLSMAAFFMLLLFETGQLPLESSGIMELGMIDEARIYEYSGPHLFLVKYSSMIKMYLLGSVFLNVFAFPWYMQSGIIGSLLDIPIMFLKWMILITAFVVINETVGKLRLFKIQDYLTVSFALAIFSILTLTLGGIQ
ncbi:MAG: NADH-quinone oxidoreductase subunit H [Thermoplasmataceae archaeon]|jgi:formate hydrogenlyase subunit 4